MIFYAPSISSFFLVLMSWPPEVCIENYPEFVGEIYVPYRVVIVRCWWWARWHGLFMVVS